MGKIGIYRSSEGSVTAAWDAVISPEINSQVLRLDQVVNATTFPGWIENVPAYHTLTVYFDPLAAPADPEQHLRNLLSDQWQGAERERRLLRIPVHYDPVVGPDLVPAAEQLGISVDALIALHTGQRYHVYMLGFMPGFPYMGVLPQQLRLPRKPVPAAKVAAGSVAIADQQTGIYPFESPGGWHVIGKISMPLFDQGKAYFQPGDEVEFYRVNES